MRASDSTALAMSSDVEPDGTGASDERAAPSFEFVYREFFGFVWSCTRRLGIVENELDDVVQEIFLVIHARLHTLQHPESIKSWIYGIVRRTASTYHRAKRAKLANASAIDAEVAIQYPQPPSPHELAEQSDQVRLLWELLDKLDPEKREVFVLNELDEMTVPEIALALDVPVNTVYSRLRVARQELEEAFTRHKARFSQRGRSCPT
jgi:RNA polymerase sigma-70 factor (ECF subfamily)